MPRLMPGSTIVHVRLPNALIQALDAEAETIRQQLPGATTSRSELIRLACARWLQPAEPAETA
jgi:hypothetical protein